MRMLAILVVAFILYTYTCLLMWEEWIQNLALRRVYYLEFNHYKNRKEELESLDNLNYPEDTNITDRPVYVPHPELRDTVPNIGLYSVLFRLPGVQLDTATCVSDSNVGHQLQVAIDFFDKIVPNQPGYSSSVAALTILPDVKRLSQAWKKWYECASKVRRLKFIRQRLQETRNVVVDSQQYDQRSSSNNSSNNNNEYNDTKFDASRSHRRNSLAERKKLETVNEVPSSDLLLPNGKDDAIDQSTADISKHATDEVDNSKSSLKCGLRYACVENDVKKSRIVASTEVNEESNMEIFLNEEEMEQMTVYYREFARSAASCGPHGCDEYSILKADAITLGDLEQEAAEEVHIAMEELRQARIEIRSDKKPEVTQFYSIHETRSVSLNADEDEGGDKDQEMHSVTDNYYQEEIQRNAANSTLWEEAEKLVGSEQYMFQKGGQVRKRMLNSGRWYNPFVQSPSSKVSASRRVVGNVTPSGVLSRTVTSESYAVVTFTSRQASIATRQSLADGSGLDGWREVDQIPIPPLADAVPWNIFDCRGCCRPVTLTISREQKRHRYKMLVIFVRDAVPWNIFDCRGCCRPVTLSISREQKRHRYKILVFIMIVFTILWTYPFVALMTLTTPDKLAEYLPFLADYASLLSSLVKPLLMTAFFSVLPQVFKALANFGSGATSVQEAERNALFYYWWFMVVFAFGFITLGNQVVGAFQSDEMNVYQIEEIFTSLANAVPNTTSFFWTGWILQQTFMILPYMYFLQFNNFLFTFLNLKCVARATAGGGPGGVVPYRIYVNVSVIFLCVVALAPLSPVLAPVAMMYLLFIIPMLKWSHIFAYRPTFDAGGMNWPLLHNIMISAIIVSQALLAISFFLKFAWPVGFLALISIIPTWTFNSVCKDTFEQSYNDAALLQTSELDGWNIEVETSMAERERYRKWLVDCHKASYVPICVNGEDNFLTSEPAVVIPTQRDQDIDIDIDPFQPSGILPHDSYFRDQHSDSSLVAGGRQRSSTLDSYNSLRSQHTSTQRGASFRRVIGSSVLQIPDGNSGFFNSEACLSGGSTFLNQFVETNTDNDLKGE
eukprot:CAMPEP_0170886452 /NCGR_PEP_ID=MMETSP0734-20130129/36748_1 /TAXON_ID=186038 /ORGANISM="Fragilariopsis kerguelensis, Strain L26-C5" /LENGTH=1066 /DNA_ID=CAMNT_0011272587 /DNA_START=673 /DNA_END=3874 /DNA_ORIENTATION=+